jgi:P4 family phage/plasmid primase-like protien
MTVLSQLFTSVDEVPGEDDRVGWALAYARAGIAVFPAHGVQHSNWVDEKGDVVSGLACTCSRGILCTNAGKHPVGGLVPRGHLDAVRTHMTLKSWFGKPGCRWNIGVATGNGLLVVDVDTKPDAEGQTGFDTLDNWSNWVGGWELPEDGLRQWTGSDGMHIWLRVAAGAQVTARNRVLPGIDLKGDGGYVIVAPSLHIKGKRYRTTGSGLGGWLHELPELAGQPLTSLMGMKGGRYKTTGVGGAGGSGSVEGYDFAAQLKDGCGIGNRDVFFNDLAFRLRKRDVDIDDAAKTMRYEWSRAKRDADGGDEFPWEHVVYKLRRVYDEVPVATVEDLPAWRPGAALVADVKSFGSVGSGSDGSVGEVTVDLTLNAPVVSGEALSASAMLRVTRPELTLHDTDSGNGERFAKRMREAVRYEGDTGRWYAWNGESWVADAGGLKAMYLTKEIIKDFYEEALTCTCDRDDGGNCAHTRHAKKSESAAARAAMLRTAQSEPEMAANADTWDSDPWQLVVRGGTLDLRTGTLGASRPSDYNTKCAGVQYLADADCPKWQEFLDFFTAGDAGLLAYLRRLAGYCLTGLITEQKFMFFEGTGANGKNVFIETLLGVLGDYGSVGTTQLITGGDEQHPTILANLQGKRMVFVDEAKANRQLNVERIKSLTAPSIEARKVKQDFFVFRNQVKLIIAGNNHPTIKDSSDGTWRRLQRIMCVGKIAEENKVKDLVDVLLREEGSGILRWAVEGCLEWRQLGDLGTPASVVEAVKEYRDEEDFIGRFIDERYEVTGKDDDYVANPDLYQTYQIWCVMNGLTKFDTLNSIKFGKVMGGERYKLAVDVRKIDGKTTRVRVGIKARES